MSKNKKFFQTDQFKADQMKWYNLLDDNGFDDIERSGKKRNQYFNEYVGNLVRNDSAHNLTFMQSRFHFFGLIRKLSFAGITELKTAAQVLEIPYKSVKVSRIEKKMLELYGNGKTIRYISNYLRSNFKHPPTSNPNPRKPYSIFYVHTKLKRLKQVAQLYGIYLDREYSEMIKKLDLTESALVKFRESIFHGTKSDPNTSIELINIKKLDLD